jgi:hypothetical protein
MRNAKLVLQGIDAKFAIAQLGDNPDACRMREGGEEF